MSLVGRTVRKLAGRAGYEVVPKGREEDRISDLSEGERRILQRVRPYTMTSVERLAALVEAVKYVVRAGVPGDFAECGVWRGGSAMAMALGLLEAGAQERSIYLYDTFEGMTAPTEKDRSFDGVPAEEQLKAQPKEAPIWCYSSLEEVQGNLRSTGYPAERIHFVKGPVEQTIPERAPERIALLRLDTDWYESTKHELEHLYPRLSPGGVLVIDDYGHWQGARQAVDEYFKAQGQAPYLHRIDNTGRIMVKG